MGFLTCTHYRIYNIDSLWNSCVKERATFEKMLQHQSDLYSTDEGKLTIPSSFLSESARIDQVSFAPGDQLISIIFEKWHVQKTQKTNRSRTSEKPKVPVFLYHFSNISCLLIQSFISSNDNWVFCIFFFIDAFSSIRWSICGCSAVFRWWRDEISPSLCSDFFRKFSIGMVS